MNLVMIIRQRIVLLVFVLFGLSLLTFSISRIVPSDPARLIGGDLATNEVLDNIREEFGLNDPLPAQYFNYVAKVVQGDLGTSIRSGQPILQELLARLPATIELALVSLIIATVIGVAAGVASAFYVNRWPDHLCRLFALTGTATPSFWLALLLIAFFYGQLGIAPPGGRGSPFLEPAASLTGFALLDSLLAGRLDLFSDALWHLALPSLTLGLVLAGSFARLVRASMLEELAKDYVRTARAMGSSDLSAACRHALPNALIPFVTQLGLSFGALLTGAVVTEAIFGWPGVGSYILRAVEAQDFRAIMGFTLLTGIVYAAANLAVDLCYLALDPAQRRKV